MDLKEIEAQRQERLAKEREVEESLHGTPNPKDWYYRQEHIGRIAELEWIGTVLHQLRQELEGIRPDLFRQVQNKRLSRSEQWKLNELLNRVLGDREEQDALHREYTPRTYPAPEGG